MKKNEWIEKYRKSIEKFQERKKTFVTGSGYPINAVYTPEDSGEQESDLYNEKIGFPGEFPYTRGVQHTMYRGKFWTMRQYAGFGDAEESNRRYRYLLNSGQTGLSVAFDLPTQIGYDSDHPMARGEIGKVGVAVDSLEDMEILFRDIPLDKVSTSMTINAPAAVLLAMYIVNAGKQGIDRKNLNGTIQNDILKEYIARGTYIFPPEPSMRIITDIFEFCSKEVPKWNMISISGYHIREAGSTAAQEVGFTLANGSAYVDAAIKAGLGVDDFAPRLSFFFNAHNDLLEEVAKFRAARRLWAKIMKNRFHAKDPRSMMLRFHTQTAGCTLTAQQPDNNIVRVTVQTLAAALGGTQSLHTNSKDEAFALPTEESVTIALRTQQIIAEESGVANTTDPLAGSYYLEALTDMIEEKASGYIDKIDSMGGVVRAIENGFMQKEIQDSSYDYQLSIEKTERIVVGVNKYAVQENRKQNLLKIDPAVSEKQISRLKALKASRSNSDVAEKLLAVRETAEKGGNLMPEIVDAVSAYCTIGEICNVLREVFGEYREKVII
jgi:methylmalonyl-CoA mutase N-terminal domain/subunit